MACFCDGQNLKCDVLISVWWLMMTLLCTCCLRISRYFTHVKEWSFPKIMTILFSLYSSRKWDREMKWLAEVHRGKIKMSGLWILWIQFYMLKIVFFLQIQASFTMRQVGKHTYVSIKQYCVDKLFVRICHLFLKVLRVIIALLRIVDHCAWPTWDDVGYIFMFSSLTL